MLLCGIVCAALFPQVGHLHAPLLKKGPAPSSAIALHIRQPDGISAEPQVCNVVCALCTFSSLSLFPLREGPVPLQLIALHIGKPAGINKELWVCIFILLCCLPCSKMVATPSMHSQPILLHVRQPDGINASPRKCAHSCRCVCRHICTR